jgi:hypothetical protein
LRQRSIGPVRSRIVEEVRRRKAMANVYYGMLVSAVLLFPWSLVALWVVGTAWERRKVRARVRASVR